VSDRHVGIPSGTVRFGRRSLPSLFLVPRLVSKFPGLVPTSERTDCMTPSTLPLTLPDGTVLAVLRDDEAKTRALPLPSTTRLPPSSSGIPTTKRPSCTFLVLPAWIPTATHRLPPLGYRRLAAG
jgi:hypothetical protein